MSEINILNILCTKLHMAAFAQVHIACAAAKAGFNGAARWPSVSIPLAQLAGSLAAIEADKCVASNSMVLHGVRHCQPNYGWWCLCVASNDGRVSQLVDQQHLECFQRKFKFVSWQWTIAQLPQCAHIYDVQEGPEEVFPPSLARPTHTVVGPHLVKMVDSPHRLVSTISCQTDPHCSRTASGQDGRLPPLTCCSPQHRSGCAG